MMDTSSNANHLENTMIANTQFLRRVLAVDSIGTAAMALCTVIFARPLSELLGIPVQLLTGMGLALLPFTAWVGWLARQTNPPRKQVWLLIASNDVWIVASLLVAFSGWLPLTTLGVEFVVAQALLTVVITTLEFVAIRRAPDATRSFA
jgi:hypothetical protein